MVTALRLGPFAESLCKKPVTNLDELRRRAAKFMQLKEMREFRIRESGEEGKSKGQADTTSLVGQREARTPRFSSYTPLNTNIGRILEEALNANLLPIPNKAATPHNANTSKHCRFHQNYEHSTEECVTLKNKIKELIQAGRLKCFVRGRPRIVKQRERTPESRQGARGHPRRRLDERARTLQRQSPRPQTQDPLLRGVINTIAGGFVGGGSLALTRKKYL